MKKKNGTFGIIGKAGGVVLALVVFFAGYYLLSTHGEAASTKPDPNSASSLGAAFTVDGALESDEVDVSSKLPGRIAKMLVEEGDQVKAGQVVAVLEAEEIDAKQDQANAGVRASEVLEGQAGLAADLENRKANDQVGQAQAGVLAAKAALGMAKQKLAAIQSGARPQEIEQVEQALAAAQAQFETATKTYNRVNSLAKEGVVSQQKADEVEMTYRSAQAQLAGTKAKLDLVKEGARKEEIEAARQQVEQAKAGVTAAEQQLQLALDARGLVGIRRLDVAAASQKVEASKGTLREVTAYKKQTQIISPITGFVSQRMIRAGEIVAPGYAILSVTRTDKFWVDVYVDETKFAGHRTGDAVDVYIPAIGKTVPGKITKVIAAADFATKRSTNERGTFDTRSVQLRITLEDHTKDLANGLSARVNFQKSGGL